jgi:glycosyltransferase involved in cell wall biosynthesis
MGGPGVHRSLRFVSHLREFGFDPMVLTIKEEDIEKSKSTIDRSLLSKLPDDIIIQRVESGIPFKLSDILHRLKIYRLFWYFLYPYFWERSAMWPAKAINKAIELIDANNIEIVYTSSGPFSALKLGYLIKKKRNVKWVADLRDPYTDAYAWSYPSRIHWYLSRFKEKKWIGKCDHLIVNTPEVKKLYLKRGLKDESKITVITNGF